MRTIEDKVSEALWLGRFNATILTGILIMVIGKSLGL